MLEAAKIKNEMLWSLGGGRYIGVDWSDKQDLYVECEAQKNADGSITVLDIREFPATHVKETTMIWASGLMAGCGIGMWLREDDGPAAIFWFFSAVFVVADFVT